MKSVLKLVHDFMDLVKNMKCGKGVQKLEEKKMLMLQKNRQKEARAGERGKWRRK